MEINATIIVQLAVILTLMLWLSKVLFAPLMRLFDEREARIQGAKAQAKALEEQSDSQASVIDERMRIAQKEAREILNESRAKGVAFQRQVIDKARAEARDKIAAAKKQIEEELVQARAQMKPFVEENTNLLVMKFVSPDNASAAKQNPTKMEFRNA